MKWRMFLPFLLLFLGLPSFAAYQQQGFSEFQEDVGGVRFVCDNQCFLLVGSLEWDYISLRWRITGSGMMGYGFLVGQQIVPGEIFQVSDSALLDKQFVFRDLSFFSQIPKDAQLVLLAQGQVMWNDLLFSFGAYSFFNKILQWWKDFWTFDTFKPYTINLLYWPMIWGKNANVLFYWIFLFMVIIVLVLTKFSFQKKILYILLWWLSLWLIYDVRMWLESISNYRHDYKTYISQSWYQKTYRERGDFYSFVDFTRDTLSKLWISSNEQIIFYTDNAWPFPGSMKYFLYPYDVQVNTGQSNYYVVYDSQFAVKNNDHFLHNWIDIWSWVFYDFSPNAFIFVK